jgi:predicted transcriptional regulator
MAQLQSIDIPDDLYGQLQTLASQQNRPVEVEVIHLLRQSIQVELSRAAQTQFLTEIKQGCWQSDQPIPDSAALLREIRGYDD